SITRRGRRVGGTMDWKNLRGMFNAGMRSAGETLFILITTTGKFLLDIIRGVAKFALAVMRAARWPLVALLIIWMFRNDLKVLIYKFERGRNARLELKGPGEMGLTLGVVDDTARRFSRAYQTIAEREAKL